MKIFQSPLEIFSTQYVTFTIFSMTFILLEKVNNATDNVQCYEFIQTGNIP